MHSFVIFQLTPNLNVSQLEAYQYDLKIL